MRDLGTELSPEKNLHLNLYIDGASKGNPGMAGAGVWMTNQEGKKLLGISRYLGRKTNNEAEYWALLIGLREAHRWGMGSIHIFTDSELVARQVKGAYRVKDSNLKSLYKEEMENLKADRRNRKKDCITQAAHSRCNGGRLCQRCSGDKHPQIFRGHTGIVQIVIKILAQESGASERRAK